MTDVALALLVVSPIADMLTGYQYYLTGSDQLFNASRIHKGAVIAAALAMTLEKKRVVATPVFVLITCLLAASSAANGLLHGGLSRNLAEFLQAQVFYAAVFSILMLAPRSNSLWAVWKYLWVTWICISVSVLASALLGTGLETYEGSGYAGFYRAANDASYLFVCASCCLLFLERRGPILTVLLVVVAAATCWTLGTKGAVLGLGLCVGWGFATRLTRNARTTLALAALAVTVVVFNYEPLFRSVAGYLPRGDYYERLLERDRDPLEVVLSGRTGGIAAAGDAIGTYSLGEWLIGKGVHHFQSEIASGRGLNQRFRRVEMDWLDLLGGQGMLGILWFYGIVCVVLKRSLRRVSTATTACMVFTASFSLVAGHVAASSSSLAMVAVLHVLTFGPGRE